jgi:hypothetical protein
LRSLDELINLPEAAIRTIAKSFDAEYDRTCAAHTAVLRFRKWHREAHPDEAQRLAEVQEAQHERAAVESLPEGVAALLNGFTSASHVSAKGVLLKQRTIAQYATTIRRMYIEGHLRSLDELINLPETAILTIAKSFHAEYYQNGNPAHSAVLRFRKWHREAHPDAAQLLPSQPPGSSGASAATRATVRPIDRISIGVVCMNLWVVLVQAHTLVEGLGRRKTMLEPLHMENAGKEDRYDCDDAEVCGRLPDTQATAPDTRAMNDFGGQNLAGREEA